METNELEQFASLLLLDMMNEVCPSYSGNRGNLW